MESGSPLSSYAEPTAHGDNKWDPAGRNERVLRLRRGTVLDASSIGMVLGVYRPERSNLTTLLEGLDPDEWGVRRNVPRTQ